EGTNEERFIVFMSTSSERDLERSKVWLIDGTFYSTPELFFQLITVHGFLYRKTFTFVYILSGTKTEIIYTRMFSYLSNTLTNSYETIVIDFEKALYNSLSVCFPTTKLSGCLFHFGQNV
ncbi:hypothetical protein CDIK_1111, partial [Cucumispora dikerogammari]